MINMKVTSCSAQRIQEYASLVSDFCGDVNILGIVSPLKVASFTFSVLVNRENVYWIKKDIHPDDTLELTPVILSQSHARAYEQYVAENGYLVDSGLLYSVWNYNRELITFRWDATNNLTFVNDIPVSE